MSTGARRKSKDLHICSQEALKLVAISIACLVDLYSHHAELIVK